MKTIAIICSFNRADLSLRAIRSALNGKASPEKLIFVDNGSDAVNAGKIKEGISKINDSRIILYRIEKNNGQTQGMIEGFEHFIQNGDWDYVWILDDDTIIDQDCLLEMYKAADIIGKNNFSFLYPNTFSAHGYYMNSPLVSEEKDLHTSYPDCLSRLDLGIVKIDIATTVNLLVNFDAIKFCGFACPCFHMWGWDTEFTKRLTVFYKTGYCVGKAKVQHLRKSEHSLDFISEDDPTRIKDSSSYYLFMLLFNKFYNHGIHAKLFWAKCFLESYRVLFKPVRFRFKKYWYCHLSCIKYLFDFKDKRIMKRMIAKIRDI